MECLVGAARLFGERWQTDFHVVPQISVDSIGLNYLPPELQPSLFSGPKKVSLREMSANEHTQFERVMQTGTKIDLPTTAAVYFL